MARTITATIPHTLGVTEARRRLADGFGQVRERLAATASSAVSFEEKWVEDCLLFEGRLMGQSLRGRLLVLSDKVHVELDLPWLLSLFADKLQGALVDEGRKLLK